MLNLKASLVRAFPRVAVVALAVLAASAIPANAGSYYPISCPYHPTDVGSISGTVTGPGGSPLAPGTTGQVTVSLNIAGQWFESGANSATFDADGSYSLPCLHLGQYKLAFRAGNRYVREFWNDAATVDAATPLTISRDGTVITHGTEITGISPQLADLGDGPGTVTGRVTSSGGTPLAGISVSSGYQSSTTTDAAGAYTLQVPVGYHSIGFWAKGYVLVRRPVTVSTGTVYPIDVRMELRLEGTTTAVRLAIAKGKRTALEARITTSGTGRQYVYLFKKSGSTWIRVRQRETIPGYVVTFPAPRKNTFRACATTSGIDIAQAPPEAMVCSAPVHAR